MVQTWKRTGRGFQYAINFEEPGAARGAQMLCGYFKLEGVDDEGRAHSPCYVRYDKRARPDATAQTRQQAGGSGEAETAVRLQICRGRPGYKALGW
jgi:hypothetical protein